MKRRESTVLTVCLLLACSTTPQAIPDAVDPMDLAGMDSAAEKGSDIVSEDLVGDGDAMAPTDGGIDVGSELNCDPLPTVALRPLEEALAQGALVPGEVLVADLNAPVSLPVDTGSEEYLFILYDLGSSRNATHSYTVELSNQAAARPRPSANSVPPGIWLPHQAMAAPGLAVPARPTPQPLPMAGDRLTFQVPFGYIVKEVEAEVMLVTDQLVICNDVTTKNPLEVVSVATMEEFAHLFESVVLPRERFFWGDESDVNQDGRVTMLFSHLVNQSSAYAFVTACDLQAPEVCGYSNEQEMIYVAIPDPEEKIHTPESFAELIAHEFNHSLYFYHKFLLNEQPEEHENVYITEGMSGLAQDLCGFNRGSQFVASAGLAEIGSVSLPDLHRYQSGAGYDAARDGALRGGSYLFLRYLFDQAGGELIDEAGSFAPSCGSELLRRWVNSPSNGPDLVAEVTGLSYDEVAANWYTALALSNRPAGGVALPVSPVFSYLPVTTDPVTGNQRGFDLWGNIMGFYPLSGPAVQAAGQADGKLREGGVEYLQVTPEQVGTITVTIDPGTAPKPFLRIVRIDLP